ALPDPPLLAAGGCHGPYFLRNIVELETDAGIVGIGETHGGEGITRELENCKQHILGRSAFAYRKIATEVEDLGTSAYAGIELACLDAIGRATNTRVCQLLGGPVREQVEFASYLFFRYAADHPAVLNDPRLVDNRGQGAAALDEWGEVRTPAAMADLAWKFHTKFGFRVHKLKAGVFEPQLELEALKAINDRFNGKHLLRIDPNGQWTVPTALSVGKQLQKLPLEYYEDPVNGQQAMAEVRSQTGLPTSTNSCVTRFHHIPEAILSHAGITMAAMIHAGAITPQLKYASDTHYVWLPAGADIIEGSNLAIVDGHMVVPRGPGLGVTLDRDKLAKAHETYHKSGMRSRDDSFTMRKFQPGWNRKEF
ncbi:MAG: hypothetical protein HYV60_00800, partial [Planctomycetia bacterium]|nr:hypothetical protein [Planctomycetia bacterium]